MWTSPRRQCSHSGRVVCPPAVVKNARVLLCVTQLWFRCVRCECVSCLSVIPTFNWKYFSFSRVWYRTTVFYDITSVATRRYSVIAVGLWQIWLTTLHREEILIKTYLECVARAERQTVSFDRHLSVIIGLRWRFITSVDRLCSLGSQYAGRRRWVREGIAGRPSHILGFGITLEKFFETQNFCRRILTPTKVKELWTNTMNRQYWYVVSVSTVDSRDAGLSLVSAVSVIFV